MNGRTGLRISGWCAGFVAVLMVLGVLSGCVPKNTGETSAVQEEAHGVEGRSAPPEFPRSNVPGPLLVKGLEYDMTVRPIDQNYWAPPRTEARCAAEAIVKGLGASRLSDLGYRVATPGASLNDIDLTAQERELVVDSFSDCVDLKQAVAAVFFGKGRISGRAASCLAGVMEDKDQLRPLVEAWAFGRPVDPFASGGAMVAALSSGAQVCVDAAEFTFPRLRMPSDEAPPIDANAPGGSPASAHPDDRPREDASTSATDGEN